MKSFLVVARDKEIVKALHSCFAPSHKVDNADNKNAALDMLSRQRYGLIFIDLAVLQESMPNGGYKAVLQQFRHLYPTVDVIVMSPQEMIREAVKAVKAGANDLPDVSHESG